MGAPSHAAAGRRKSDGDVTRDVRRVAVLSASARVDANAVATAAVSSANGDWLGRRGAANAFWWCRGRRAGLAAV